VIDAAGAIYVIGGQSWNGIPLQDVWVSTDRGARPASVGEVVGGYTKGVQRWVLRRYSGAPRGSSWVLQGY
jgi:hypothetical protein